MVAWRQLDRHRQVSAKEAPAPRPLDFAPTPAQRDSPTIRAERSIDLRITDVGMPGLNGRQVADAARTIRPDLHVLFITGLAAQTALNGGHLAPGMQILTKPFALAALRDRVAATLAPACLAPASAGIAAPG